MTETNDTILEIACRHAHECGLISADRVEFLDSVRAACAVNYCGQYGTRWTCPPGVGTVAEWRDKCLVYRTALVFSTKHELEDPYDFEGMAAASKAHSAIECALLDELGFEDRLVLGACVRFMREVHLSVRALPFPLSGAAYGRSVRNFRGGSCKSVRDAI